jgi:FKBP-type peptidyl-prolyl cis-trans isomerase
MNILGRIAGEELTDFMHYKTKPKKTANGYSTLLAVAICFAFALGNFGNHSARGDADVPSTAPSAPPSTAPDSAGGYSQGDLLETWGWALAQEMGVAKIDVNPAELTDFTNGWSAAITGKPCPSDLRAVLPDIDRVSKARRAKLVAQIRQRNRDAAKTFFDQLKTRPNLIPLSDGCYCEILQPGAGPSPKPNQTINVHFVGHLIDGTEFTQMGPTDFVFVANHAVCHGWMDAIQKMNAGAHLRLYVPPPLEETEAAQFGVEPDSAMIFDIDLVSFRDTAAQDLADALVPAAPTPPPPPPSGLSDQQVIAAWGWALGSRVRAITDGLSDDDLARLNQGLVIGIQGGPPPNDLQKIGPSVEQFIRARAMNYQQAQLAKRKAASDAMFAQLKSDSSVVFLPDGLAYKILQPGTGPYPKPTQTVNVRYVGKLINGTVFDSSSLGPIDLQLNGVIPGWAEGLQKINEGGSIRLFIPPNLAYGDNETGGIPAGSTLIFDVTLLHVKEQPENSPNPAPQQ